MSDKDWADEEDQLRPASVWVESGSPMCPHCGSKHVHMTRQTALMKSQSYYCEKCGGESGVIEVKS